MDAVSIATSMIAAKQQQIQSAVQVAVLKNQRDSQQALVDMISASSANLAAIQASAPAGAGRRVDLTV